MRLTILACITLSVLANCCPNIDMQRRNSAYPIAPGARQNETSNTATSTATKSSPDNQASETNSSQQQRYTGGASSVQVPMIAAGAIGVAVLAAL